MTSLTQPQLQLRIEIPDLQLPHETEPRTDHDS